MILKLCACFRLTLPVGLALLLAFTMTVDPSIVSAYTVYGYEDSLGMLHTSSKPVSKLHAPLYTVNKGKKKTSYNKLVPALKKNNAIQAPNPHAWKLTELPNYKSRRAPYPHPAAKGKIMKYIAHYSKVNQLDPKLVYAVIETESNFRSWLVSRKGAKGLMQIMPETQRGLGLHEPFDPKQNIKAGTKFLRLMLNKFQNTPLALAAYNAGPAVVQHYGGVPPYVETRVYVARIMNRYADLKGL